MLTPEQVEERFQRIEGNLDRIAAEREADRKEWNERMKHIQDAHIELEGFQLNQAKLHEKFMAENQARGKEIDERLVRLEIALDRLVAKDLRDLEP